MHICREIERQLVRLRWTDAQRERVRDIETDRDGEIEKEKKTDTEKVRHKS